MHSRSPHPAAENPKHEPLSPTELQRLTLFKWRYTFESLGFRPYEVAQLVFLTWLRATARVHG